MLLDDRKERAGVIFTDMDLIGIPHRIIISETGIDEKAVEYKSRIDTTTHKVEIDNIVNFMLQHIKK